MIPAAAAHGRKVHTKKEFQSFTLHDKSSVSGVKAVYVYGLKVSGREVQSLVLELPAKKWIGNNKASACKWYIEEKGVPLDVLCGGVDLVQG